MHVRSCGDGGWIKMMVVGGGSGGSGWVSAHGGGNGIGDEINLVSVGMSLKSACEIMCTNAHVYIGRVRREHMSLMSVTD